MFNSLQGLPPRVVVDTNVLLDATFVSRGGARKALLLLRKLGQSIYVDEMVWLEACRKLEGFSVELGLTFRPIDRLNEFVRGIGPIYVPPSAPIQSKKINRADRHVAAAAQHNQAWLLTGDVGLIVQARKIGIEARFPQDVILHARVWLPTGEPLSADDFIRVVPPTVNSGLIFARLLPGGWAGRKNLGSFTACEIEGVGIVFYDSDTEDWIFKLMSGDQVAVRYPITHDRAVAVCGTYQRNVNDGSMSIAIRVGYFGSAPASVHRNIGYALPRPGRTAIGHTLASDRHWNGHIRSLVVGPQVMGPTRWKNLMRTPEGSPNPYDDNALRHALRLIQNNFELRREILSLSLSYPGP